MIEDHVFRARVLWDSSRGRYVHFGRECGFLTEAYFNSTTAEPGYCARPPAEHALAYGARWEPPRSQRVTRIRMVGWFRGRP